MSDAVVPSYRVAREPSGIPWRMLAVAGGLLGVLAAGAGGYWAFRSAGVAGGVPLVEADPRPFKVRPDDPGGLRVPNQAELIMERPGARAQTPAQAGRAASVAPAAEAPDLGGLRAAVAPPPPPRAAAPAAPVAVPAIAPQAEPMPAPVPPTAAPAAAPVARPVPAGRTQVQLGALPTEEAARAEWERLTRRAPELFQGRTPQITRLDRGEGQVPLFRLRTGGIADQDSAVEFCTQVRARGGACVPVRS